MSKKMVLSPLLSKAKEAYKNGEKDNARDYCDMGLYYIVEMKQRGMGEEDEIDNIPISLWKERFWSFLERKNLMLG
jgi:hypothetical protein